MKIFASTMLMAAALGLTQVWGFAGPIASADTAQARCGCTECRCPDCNGEHCTCEVCKCEKCGCLE